MEGLDYARDETKSQLSTSYVCQLFKSSAYTYLNNVWWFKIESIKQILHISVWRDNANSCLLCPQRRNRYLKIQKVPSILLPVRKSECLNFTSWIQPHVRKYSVHSLWKPCEGYLWNQRKLKIPRQWTPRIRTMFKYQFFCLQPSL